MVERENSAIYFSSYKGLSLTVNFQMSKLDLEKAEEPDIKLPTSVGSSKNKRVPEKHLLLLY